MAHWNTLLGSPSLGRQIQAGGAWNYVPNVSCALYRDSPRHTNQVLVIGWLVGGGGCFRVVERLVRF